MTSPPLRANPAVVNARQVAVEAIQAADEFLSRRLWRRLANEQFVAIELPGRPPITAGVLGAAGQEFGLHLLVGERAVEEMLALCRGDLRHDGLDSPSLSFTLTPRSDIVPPFDRALVEARRQGRMAPMLLCVERGLAPRPPRKQECEILILATRALLIADAAGRLEPGDPEVSGQLLTLQVSGKVRKPDVAVAMQSIATVSRETWAEPGKAEPPPELIGLPTLEARYCVGLPFLPVTITGDDALTRVVLVLDATHDKIATIAIVEGDHVAEARDRVLAVLHDGSESVPPGLPEKMVIADLDLYRELAASLRALGIDCDFERDVPELAAVVESLGEHLHATAPPDPGSAPEPSGPDDLEAWKAVDMAVTNLLAAAGMRAAMENDKAWRRYLGVDRAQRNPLVNVGGEGLITGYLDWFMHHHRGTKRSRTVAERLLAGKLSPSVRSVMLARQTARHSLYRVDRIEVGEGVETHDIIAGTRCFVTDRAFSLTTEQGDAFPARLYRAGAYWFGQPAGPVLRGTSAVSALEFLEGKHGLQADEAVDPNQAHLLGRLWSWIEDQPRRQITLQNHDGHALRWHTARFSVADPTSLSKALEARVDIEVVEPGSEWAWQRNSLFLGRLELFGGEELVLEVNSAERHVAARGWLEQLAGVTFESVVEREVDPGRDGRPLDDRLPRLGPIDAEASSTGALEAVQRVIDARCMDWLDESIPMLGGESPRQTCATPAGRRKVAQLIRSYPDPMGTPGVRVPRERMLAELGLGEPESSGEEARG